MTFLPIDRWSMNSRSSPSRTSQYAVATIPPAIGINPTTTASMMTAMARLPMSGLAGGPGLRRGRITGGVAHVARIARFEFVGHRGSSFP